MPVRQRRKRSAQHALTPDDEVVLTIGPKAWRFEGFVVPESELRRLREVYRRHWAQIDHLDEAGKPIGRSSWAYRRFVDEVDDDAGCDEAFEGLSGRDLDRAVGLPSI
jgi:hypothetical protein